MRLGLVTVECDLRLGSATCEVAKCSMPTNKSKRKKKMKAEAVG